jgi:hypothetical protein
MLVNQTLGAVGLAHEIGRSEIGMSILQNRLRRHALRTGRPHL